MRDLPARTWLWVPGHDRRKIERARSAGSDAVVVDLEDGVPPVAKALAREVTAEALRAGGFGADRGWVRVNAPADGDAWRADLEAVLPAAPAGIVVPKVFLPEHATAVQAVLRARAAATALALIVTEQPDGVLAMRHTLRAVPDLAAGLWGSEDLSAELGATRVKDASGRMLEVFAVVRSLFLLEAASAGVERVDTPYLDLDDLDGLRVEAEAAFAMGFTGKQVIHPAHVAMVNAAFTPSAEVLDTARRTVAAFGGSGGGAVRVDGAMADPPHLKRAQRLLAAAEAYAAVRP